MFMRKLELAFHLRQAIHMKFQALLSQKKKKKEIKMLSAAVVIS